jgi:type IV pilus assembly protein PilW
MKLIKLIKLQSGFSMVEIMIAMLIGTFLTGGLIQMFITTKSTNKLQDAVSRLQENGGFALEAITQDVREAGYSQECSGEAKKIITGINDHDPTANYTDVNPTGTVYANILENTDWIVIQQTGNCSTVTYYIGKGMNGQPSLCRFAGALTTNPSEFCGNDELIEGIENMQILYGVEVDPPIRAISKAGESVTNPEFGIPNYYVTADKVVQGDYDWNDVVSVQISLLVRTMDNNITNETLPDVYNAYKTANNLASLPDLGADDKRVRRVYTTTVTLRNRLQ